MTKQSTVFRTRFTPSSSRRHDLFPSKLNSKSTLSLSFAIQARHHYQCICGCKKKRKKKKKNNPLAMAKNKHGGGVTVWGRIILNACAMTA